MYERSVLLRLITKADDAELRGFIETQRDLEQALVGAYMEVKKYEEEFQKLEDQFQSFGPEVLEAETYLEKFYIAVEKSGQKLAGAGEDVDRFREELKKLGASEEQLDQLNTTMREYTTRVDELADAQGDAGSATKQFIDKQERLAEVMGVSADDFFHTKKELRELEEGYQRTGQEARQYGETHQRALRETEEGVERTGHAVRRYGEAVEAAAVDARKLWDDDRREQALAEEEQEVSQLWLGYRKLEDSYERTGRAARGAADDQERLRREMRGAGDEAEKQVGTLGNLAGKLGGFTKYIGASIVGAVTFGLFNALEDGARKIKDFVLEAETAFAEYDYLVRQTFAQAPDTSFVFDDLANQARAAGVELGFLPNDVIPAVRKALNLGIDEGNIFSAVEDAAKAAKVSGADLQETLVAGVSTAKAYGLEMYDMTEILDMFSIITQNSVLEQQDLNTGLSEIINTAAQAGIGLEDVAAAMITMSNQGDSMREITELLSHMFVQISISGTALGGAFEEAAGVNWQEFIAGGGDLIEALTILEQHADSTGTTLGNMIGGESKFYRDQRAALGVLELTNQHTEDLHINAKKAADAQGALDESYKDMADSTQLLLEQTEAAKVSFQTYLGEALEPTTRAYNELKIAAYEAGIEILKAHIFKDQILADVAEASEDNADAIAREREEFIKLAAETTKFDELFIELNNKYKPDETFDPQAIRDYTTAITVLNDAIRDNPDVGVSHVKTLIADAIGGAQAFVEISQKGWQEAVTGVEIYTSSVDTAKAKLEEMMSTAENFATVVSDVTDGDTFDAYIDGDIKSVRLAGVDTPETGAEWEEFYAETFGFDPSQQALELTKDLLLDGNVELGPQLGESYDRAVHEAFVDNRRLATILAKEGLAIPMTFGLDDPEAKRQITAAFEEAAVAGKGIFSNAEIAKGFLDGSINSLYELKGAWDAAREATAEAKAEVEEYMEAFWSDEAGGDLFAAWEKLDEAEGPKKIAEAMNEVDLAAADLEESFLEMGAAAYAGNTTAQESAVGLYESLGLISEAEREVRENYVFMSEQMEIAGAAMGDMGINAEIAGAAILGLRDGLYENAEAAIAAAEANQTYADIVNRVGDTDLADKLARQEFAEPAEADIVAAKVDIDTRLYDLHMDEVRSDVAAFDEEKYDADGDLNIVPYTDSMKVVRTDLAAYDTEKHAATVDVLGADTVSDTLQTLIQTALAYATDYHAYVYTHHVDTYDDDGGGDTEGSQASGGPVYRTGGYYVGEFGPEYVNLRAGDHVTPTRDLGAGGKAYISYNVLGDSAASAERVSKSMIRELRKAKLI